MGSQPDPARRPATGGPDSLSSLPTEIPFSPIRHPTRKKRPFLGRDGSAQDPVLASALGPSLAGARARAALLRPGPNVPAVPAAAC